MLKKITILGGLNKSGQPEKIQKLVIQSGEILAVVGPTGSGKTQLIGDIGQVSETETLTGRRVMVDDGCAIGNNDQKKRRYLMAQVSQNMNFVIDMTISEFLMMHAEVRAVSNPQAVLTEVLAITNHLSGESVTFETNLTQLSGGQSRALMVADVALLSNAPVVLIDEIENAGIDRLKALDILTGQGKIVLVVSHDPTLMLMADKRVVMKNGGMDGICYTSSEERQILDELVNTEKRVNRLREQLRKGRNLRSDYHKEEELKIWQKYSSTYR